MTLDAAVLRSVVYELSRCQVTPTTPEYAWQFDTSEAHIRLTVARGSLGDVGGRLGDAGCPG